MVVVVGGTWKMEIPLRTDVGDEITRLESKGELYKRMADYRHSLEKVFTVTENARPIQITNLLLAEHSIHREWSTLGVTECGSIRVLCSCRPCTNLLSTYKC